MTNLPLSDVFAGEVIVPDEGEEITAVAQGVGQGPVRPGYQALLNKIWSVVSGKAQLRGVQVGLTPGTAVNPADGTIQAFRGIYSATGPIEATGGDVLASSGAPGQGNVRASDGVWGLRVLVRNVLAGDVDLTGGWLRFGAIVAGALGGNPARTEGLTNELRPLNTCKAWCRIVSDGATPPTFTFKDGANILTAAPVAGSDVRLRVYFVANMADQNYSVIATGIRYDTTTPFAACPAGSDGWKVGYFDLLFPFDVSGGTPKAFDVTIHVFGRQ